MDYGDFRSHSGLGASWTNGSFPDGRFGPLPQPTTNLVKLIQIKRQAIEAHIAKIDVGAKGTLVSFHQDSFPDPAGLIR